MAQIGIRLLAYFLAGLGIGGAGFLSLHPEVFLSGHALLIAVLIAVTSVACAAVFLFRASRAPGKGIRITPAFSLAAMDLICLIASAIAVFFIFEGYSVRFTGAPSSLGDPLLADVILFLYLPAAGVLAAFVSLTGVQRITIDAQGIRTTGQVGMVAWDDIMSFEPDAQYVVVSRIGLPVPKHLRTNLLVVTESGEKIAVYEPGLKTTRREILVRLQALAPVRLQGDIERMQESWL